jgi:hypothetical protein
MVWEAANAIAIYMGNGWADVQPNPFNGSTAMTAEWLRGILPEDEAAAVLSAAATVTSAGPETDWSALAAGLTRLRTREGLSEEALARLHWDPTGAVPKVRAGAGAVWGDAATPPSASHDLPLPPSPSLLRSAPSCTSPTRTARRTSSPPRRRPSAPPPPPPPACAPLLQPQPPGPVARGPSSPTLCTAAVPGTRATRRSGGTSPATTRPAGCPQRECTGERRGGRLGDECAERRGWEVCATVHLPRSVCYAPNATAAASRRTLAVHRARPSCLRR